MLLTPRDDAQFQSSFIAINARAAVGRRVEILDESRSVSIVEASSEGRIHKVVQLSNGKHTIRLRYKNSPVESSASVRIRIANEQDAVSKHVIYENLQEGDILLVHPAQTDQDELYEPTYTHASVYVGGNSDGTPLVAEAVANDLAEGLGEVRAVPIERSLSFRDGARTGIFRVQPLLTFSQREAVVAYALSLVNRGLRFWSAADDFGALYRTLLLWDTKRDRPFDELRFHQALDALDRRKTALDRFNCATLVWRSYWEGTQHQIDLSEPNQVKVGGTLQGMATAAFIDRLRSHFVVPDTLYLSGKLLRVDHP